MAVVFTAAAQRAFGLVLAPVREKLLYLLSNVFMLYVSKENYIGKLIKAFDDEFNHYLNVLIFRQDYRF